MQPEPGRPEPSVSVVIPTFNCARFVVDAVESALDQTYGDREIIVVDDGSSDDTQQRLQRYRDRIRYLFNEHRERSAARNLGIRAAAGRYIAFLDADDYWRPEKLAVQMRLMEQEPDLVWSYCQAHVVDPQGKSVRLLDGLPGASPDTPQTLFGQLALSNFVCGPSSVLVARKALDEVGLFDETLRYIEDWDLWLRLAMRHGDVGRIATPLVYYRAYGDFLPEKLDRFQWTETALRMLRKNFALAAEQGAQVEGERCALGHALWLGALAAYALNQTELGRARCHEAIQQAPELFEDATEVSKTLLAFARNLHLGAETPLPRARRFIEQALASLPEELGVLATRRGEILGKLYASEVLDSGERRPRKGLLQSALRAVCHDPSWLRNRAFIANLCVRALGVPFAAGSGALRRRAAAARPPRAPHERNG